MLVPLLSLAALLVAIALSVVSRLNVGLLGLGFAYALGVFGAGMKVREVPITFVERTSGASKMSRKIVVEALWRVTAWGVDDKVTRVRKRSHARRAAGGGSA